MKNILLLLAGQLREFDSLHVIKSWDKFRKDHNLITIGCFWDNRGASKYGGSRDRYDEIIDRRLVKECFRTDHIELFSHNDFMSALPKRYQKYLGLDLFDCIISHSFLRYQAKILAKALDLVKVDSVVLTRPDLIFLRELPSHCFDDGSILWHQNGINSKAYYPNRIYDILCVSGIENIFKMCEFYNDEESPASIDAPPHNGLSRMDSCRIYFNYLNSNRVNHQSLDLLYADVFRHDTDINNYKYSYLDGDDLWGVS